MSMSGQTYSPCIHKLSPTLATTVSSHSSEASPRISLADPVPPARATTFKGSPEEVLLLLNRDRPYRHLPSREGRPPDHRSRDAGALPGREFSRPRQLVGDRRLGHSELVPVPVDLPPV